MRDRAGKAYDVFGGLFAGTIGGALLSTSTGALTPKSPAWIWVALIALLVLSLYVMIAGILDWPLPFRKVRIEFAVNSGRAVAKEIHEWLSARRDSDPIGEWNEPHDNWGRTTERYLRHSTRTSNEWREKFAVRSLAAYDRLFKLLEDEDRNHVKDRDRVERPTNPIGMEAAASAIGVMAERVAERYGIN